ncbi:MAG: hypothetical protein [brine shrimp arlivirus 4]|nr:MAG: hypothetical protein [brine shrimp arlivirus 4]
MIMMKIFLISIISVYVCIIKNEEKKIMASEPQTQSTSSSNPEQAAYCPNHAKNFICAIPCPLPHSVCTYPKMEDEDFPEWLNMMLHSLKENQRLVALQIAKQGDYLTRKLSTIDNRIRVLSEQIAQFSFASGAQPRPATDLRTRAIPNPDSKYSLEPPPFFTVASIRGSERRGRPRGRGRGSWAEGQSPYTWHRSASVGSGFTPLTDLAQTDE